jgi:hypothetical protein
MNDRQHEFPGRRNPIETSTGGFLPREPIPGETYRGSQADPEAELSDLPVWTPIWCEASNTYRYEAKNSWGRTWRLWYVDTDQASDPFPAGFRFAPVDALDQVNFVEKVGGDRDFDKAAYLIDAQQTVSNPEFRYRMAWPGQSDPDVTKRGPSVNRRGRTAVSTPTNPPDTATARTNGEALAGSAAVRRIQPEMLASLKMPYPYFINPDGTVRRQDVWKGEPAALAGFQNEVDVHQVDLATDDWFAGDVSACVGMYPVFFDKSGDMFNIKTAIATATVHPELSPEMPEGTT